VHPWQLALGMNLTLFTIGLLLCRTSGEEWVRACVLVRVRVRVRVCVCVCVCVCVSGLLLYRTSGKERVGLHIYIYICMYVCMMYVYMYVYMYTSFVFGLRSCGMSGEVCVCQ
jgi:hypothetical protein